MWKGVTSEKEDKIIEKIAHAIAKYDMTAPSLLFLTSMEPLSFFGGQMTRIFIGPYLPLSWYEYIPVFEKRENVNKLIRRIKELKKEKRKPKGPSFIEKFKRFIKK